MNKTKKRNNKNKHKHNHSKRNHSNNTTRPPKHNYIYKNTNTNTNTNTRKHQKGGIKGKKWSISNRLNLAMDIKSNAPSSSKNEKAERNEWLKYLISDEWKKDYTEVLSKINEYKNKHNQMWVKMLIRDEKDGQAIVDLEDDRQFIKKVGDYFSDTFVKPLRDNKNNINTVLKYTDVLSKMCRQIIYEPVFRQKDECPTIIEGLINRNFEILQLEVESTKIVMENNLKEQEQKFAHWIKEDNKQQENQQQEKQQLNIDILNELTQDIEDQDLQNTLQKFKEFGERKAKIDLKLNKLEKEVLGKSGEVQSTFAEFKKKNGNWKSFKNLGNILTKLNLTIEIYTNLIKEDEVFRTDPSLTYYESNKKTCLGNISVCLEEFNSIMVDIFNKNKAATTEQQMKDVIQNFSKEVKDKLDADLKYTTKQIQLTNLIKELTFLHTQRADIETLIINHSSNKNYQIYKDKMNELTLNNVLNLYTIYLSNIEKRDVFNPVLDSGIDKNQKDIKQINSIISDAKEKEKNATVKQQEIDLLKVRQKILEKEIKGNISQENKNGSVSKDEDLTDSTEEEKEGEREGERDEEHKATEPDSDAQTISSTATQGSLRSQQSLISQESLNSLNSLESIKSDLSNTPLLKRSKFTEIKNMLNKISKFLKESKSRINSESNKLFSFSGDDVLDQLTNVINSSRLPQPPYQSPIKLTSLTQTMQGLLNGLSKQESKTETKTETKPIYSETTTNPMFLKKIQEGTIEKQDIKMKEIARLEHKLRHINSELGITRNKYDNKNKDLVEEDLRNRKFIIENDLNIAMRELDNLTQQTKTISNKPDILKDVEERKDNIRKKKESAKKSAEKLAEEFKMEERRKMIEKRETITAELVHKILQIPSDKYDKTKMIERIDTLIKHAKSDKAREMLEETKQIINGEKDDISRFKQKFSSLGFYETMVNVPTPTIISKPVTKSVAVAPVIISSLSTTTPTTTKLNWQNINDPTTNYLNQITKGTVGNSEPIIKYNQDIINSKREKIIAEAKAKAEAEAKAKAKAAAKGAKAAKLKKNR